MRASEGRTTWSGPADPVLSALLEEFSNRIQAGEAVDVDTFARVHPERAEELLRYLPAIEMLADLGRSEADGPRPDPLAGPGSAAGRGLLGDFEIVREIGRGGMGVVYEALQVSLGRRVALKVLPFAAALDPRQLRRFQVEAQAAAHLQHPHVVPIFAVGNDRGVHYYAMQFIEGRTVADLIRGLRQGRERTRAESASVATGTGILADVGDSRGLAKPDPFVGDEGRNPESLSPPPLRDATYFRTVARLGLQAAGALEHAHSQGVIHRDIKPANLLLDPSGNLWITDFGLARFQSDAGLTLTGDQVGTLRYMSPEQALGGRVVVDHRTDLYSLGVTLYELLTLRPAIAGGDRAEILRRIAGEDPPPPRRSDGGVPRALENVVLKAIDKDRDLRYATARDLADDLARFLDDRPVAARPPTLLERASKWARRHRPAVAAGLALLVLAVVGLSVGMLVVRGERKESDRLRRLADSRSKDLERQAGSLDWQLYISRVNRAHGEWEANNVALAERLLDDCPPARRDWEWRHVKRLCHLDRLSYRGHAHAIRGLTFSGDGRLVLSGSTTAFGDDGELHCWEAATGRLVHADDAQGVTCAAFRPTGDLAATASNDGTITFWETATWRPRRILRSSISHTSGLAFSPDGQRIATAGGSHGPGRLALWDVASGDLLREFEGHHGAVWSVAFSGDGNRLASGGEDGTVRIWDAQRGTSTHVLKGHDGAVYSVAFRPDGSRIASGGWDATVRTWDPRSGAAVQVLRGHASFVRAVAFSPDGRRIASGSEDNGVRLWDAEEGRGVGMLRGHTGFVQALAYSPDGSRIATGGTDATVKVWDATADPEGPALRHDGWVTGVAFHPDGLRLATSSGDRTAKVWDVATGRLVVAFRGHRWQVGTVAFRPDGKRVASASNDQTVKVWDPETGGVERTLRGHAGAVNAAAYSGDGRRIASAGWDHTARVWDATTGRETLAYRGHHAPIAAVAFRPDGRRVASAGIDRVVRVWDPESGRTTLVLPCVVSGGNLALKPGMVAFSPDGALLAACSEPEAGSPDEVRLFDATTGRLVRRLRGHSSTATAVAFNHAGTRIASASTDRTLKLWDVATGDEVLTLRGHAGGVLAVAFSRDDRRIATGGIDGTARAWDAAETTVPQPDDAK